MTTGSPLGDLLRAWHSLGATAPEPRAAIAAALGLEWVPRTGDIPARDQKDQKKSSTPLPTPVPQPSTEKPVKADTPISVQLTPVARDGSDASELLRGPAMEIQRTLQPFPPKQPLLNPNWTRGIFSSRLSQSVLSRRIDFPAMVRSELRAEPLLRLPWRRLFTLSKGVRCFIDVGTPLDILVEDRAQALQALRSLAGFERVSVGFFETVPDAADARIDPASEFFAAAQSPLLLLTDFGRYSMPGRRWALTEEWLAFVERERERGTARIVALTPVPRPEWPKALLPEIEIVLWDWETGVERGRRDAR